MIRLLTVFSLLALFCGGAVAAPFSVSYVGTIDNRMDAFTNIVDGETYSVTLVMDNGGSSSQSQTWVASDLVSVKWEFNDSRNVVFEQNIDPSYTDNYSIIGAATTDANGALTGFFTDVSNGGTVFQAVGMPDLVSPAEWFINGQNGVFFSDGFGRRRELLPQCVRCRWRCANGHCKLVKSSRCCLSASSNRAISHTSPSITPVRLTDTRRPTWTLRPS